MGPEDELELRGPAGEAVRGLGGRARTRGYEGLVGGAQRPDFGGPGRPRVGWAAPWPEAEALDTSALRLVLWGRCQGWGLPSLSDPAQGSGFAPSAWACWTAVPAASAPARPSSTSLSGKPASGVSVAENLLRETNLGHLNH